MKKFLKTQREIIALALFFLIVGVLAALVILPLLRKITAIKDEIEQGAIKQNITNQRLFDLPKIGKQYTEINNQQDKINILLDKQQAVALIERLEKLAQETNNTIAITIQDAPQQKNLPIAPVAAPGTAPVSDNALLDSLPSKDYLKLTIMLTGDYNGLFKFISSLESLEYYSDITLINISHLIDNADANTVTSSGGSGVLNPFNPKDVSTSVTPAPAKKIGNKLSASLEVVFYSKKQ